MPKTQETTIRVPRFTPAVSAVLHRKETKEIVSNLYDVAEMIHAEYVNRTGRVDKEVFDFLPVAAKITDK